MSTTKETTLVDPKWRLCSGRHTVDGVLFLSYSTGIMRYTRVSEDGKIQIDSANHTTYAVRVLGHGWIVSKNGRTKKFRFNKTAARAGIKLAKELKR